MPLSIFFWAMTVITLALSAAQIMGYNFLNIIVLFLIMDIVILELNRKTSHKKLNTDIKDQFIVRLENIEKAIGNVVSAVGPAPVPIDSSMDIKLEEHKNVIKSEIKNDLDMIARKAIDIENKMTLVRRDFSVLLSSFNERIKKLEEGSTYTEIKTVQ